MLTTIARRNHLIPSRTQKWNVFAPMVVWFAHVRVGHRQLSIPSKPPSLSRRGFSFGCGLKIRGFLIWFEDLETALRLFFKSRYLFSGLNELHVMMFQALSKLITVLKGFNFSLIDDLYNSLPVRAKVIQINIFFNPLKNIDYLNPA